MTKGQVGVLVGLLAGVPVGGLGGTIASIAVRTQKHADVRRGWDASPVMVVNRDLAAGELLTMEKVDQASVAERFVLSAQVKAADASYVVNQRLRVPMKAGQPLEWVFFPLVKNDQREAREACLVAIDAKRGSR